MKKILTCFLLLALLLVCGMFLPLQANAATSDTCGDNLTWTLDNEGTLTISGTGPMKNYKWPNCGPWGVSVKTAVIESGVTTIGDYAFYGCVSLNSLTLGDSVTTIGDCAFQNCESLTGIWVTADNPNYCSDAAGVLFNKDQTTLIRAPAGISGSYTIPHGVTTIGGAAFSSCYSLTSVTIPDSVITIGDSAFGGCTSLNTVTIPASVTTIGDSAFVFCTGLASVTIPDSVTTIGDVAFGFCALTSITIPDSVTTIGDSAFTWCVGLPSVTIPANVTTIGDCAFSYCASLTGIWVAADNPNYSNDTYGVLFNKDKTTLLQVPGSISDSYTVPDSVTTIGERSFAACVSLTAVTVPDSVTTIGDYAFVLSPVLTSVTLGDSVTAIGMSAFSSCESLTNIWVAPQNPVYSSDAAGVLFNKDQTTLIQAPEGISGDYTIPVGVTTIGEDAFDDCKSLTSVTIPDSVTTIGKWAFYGCDSLTNVYYFGTEAQWSALKKNIGDYNNPLLDADITYDYEKRTMVVYSDHSDLCIEDGDIITLRVGFEINGVLQGDPTGITFQIADPSLVMIVDSGFEQNFFYLQLQGVNEGVTDVVFSDSGMGKALKVPVAICKSNYLAFTLSNVPTQKVGIYEANFYNGDGLYIDSYKYEVNDDQSAHITFNAYNANYTYGIVEIYNEDGKLIDAELIEKKSAMNTGYKAFFWDGAGSAARDMVMMWEGYAVGYRLETNSKWTPVEVDVPKNGFIRITTNIYCSETLATINIADYMMTLLSLAGKIGKYDPYNITFVEDLKTQLLSAGNAGVLKDGAVDLLKNFLDDVAEDRVITAARFSQIADDLAELAKQMDWIDMIEKSATKTGIDLAGKLLVNLTGMGKAVEGVFIVGKVDHAISTLFDLALSKFSGYIDIQNQGGGLRTNAQIKLESNVDFAPDVALQAYSVEVDEEFLEFVQQADQETYDILTKGICHTYNISLLKNNEETQHSDYVTVYIPIPEDLRLLSLAGNVKVYRIEEDGSLTDMDAVVEDGCMRFATKHFSLYTLVGYMDTVPGDLDGDGVVTEDDAIYLLQHVMMTELFPVSQPVDYDGNGLIEEDDAIYLLQYAMMPELFPLT